MFDHLAKKFAPSIFCGGDQLISPLRTFSAALLVAIAPSALPGLSDGQHGATRVWENFTAIEHLPKGAPRYRALRHGSIEVSARAAQAALARFRPKIRIDFLGKQLGVPGHIDFLRLYPVARRGRAMGGVWHFTCADSAGRSQTELIPVGPPGSLHRLRWARPTHRKAPLPPIPGFPPPGSPPAGSSTIYLGAWSVGMARVTGWIPGSARSFVLSTSGVPKVHALRAFQIDADYSSVTESLQIEWPGHSSLWPLDRVLICESFWPFPSARFGAAEDVSKAMLASGLPHAKLAQILTSAEKVLKRLSPEESFLLQIAGVTPPPVLHAGKAVQRAVMLLAQASFYRYFRRFTHFTAVATHAGGKDVYAVACYRKNLASGGPWFEYNLCFTKSGRLWCIGHQDWKKGRRSPVALAAMAVNLSGLQGQTRKSDIHGFGGRARK